MKNHESLTSIIKKLANKVKTEERNLFNLKRLNSIERNLISPSLLFGNRSDFCPVLNTFDSDVSLISFK